MAKNNERGAVNTIKLKTTILFNGNKVTTAIIELDHINYGLNSKTKCLNTKKRTNSLIKTLRSYHDARW